MGKYMEMIYIDSQDNARLTGVGAEFKTDDETVRAFESVRSRNTDISEADFLLDLHEDNGDLVDSIPISKETFTSVSGEPFLGEQHYIDHDKRMNGQAIS